MLARIRRRAEPDANGLAWGSDDDFFWSELTRHSRRAYHRRVVQATPVAQRTAAQRLDAIESLEALFPRGAPPPHSVLVPSSLSPADVPPGLRLYEVVRPPFAAFLVAVPAERVIYGLLVADLGQDQAQLVSRIRSRMARIAEAHRLP